MKKATNSKFIIQHLKLLTLNSSTIIPVCFLLINFSSFASVDSLKHVYKFDIKEDISPPAWRQVKKAIEKAHEKKSNCILIHLNTYGGQVDIADSIRSKILQSLIPVYVLIENNAASAGALISIACDSIYMMPGSTIGAATVVNQSGEKVPDKYQSYMRSKMRATAEMQGRNPDIAEAMVDPYKTIPGIIDSGKVLTFTVKEAIRHGFCEGEVNSYDELLKHAGVSNYIIEEHFISAMDKIIGFLIHPIVSAILIMLIIGGIYFELQSPGIGFPLIAAITGAVLYFAPLYLEGLASHWEIVMAIAGVILIIVELFVTPGFGFIGIAGAALFFIGLVLALVSNVGFDFGGVNTDAIVTATATVLISSLVALVLSVFLGAKFLHSRMFSHAILNSTQEKEQGYISTDIKGFSLAGKTGVAATMLRPGGKVEIEGEIYDAIAESGYVEKGEAVKVLRYETAQLVVRKIED